MTTPPSSLSPTATASNAVNGSANANADPNGNTNNNPNAPRSQRPPPRSNFDLEPNPFEHSFSSTSGISHSSATTETPKHGPSSNEHTRTGSGSKSSLTMTNGGVANGNTPLKPGDDEDSKPTLPPLAALESPAGQNYASWALASSLRSGPLSPAMLAGPTTQQTPSLGLGAFDSSFVRTGLTPDVSRTGLTPLIGGPGGFPPPSPNTAALFALVNGTSAGAPLGSNVAITPGTLNAITGALNQSLGAINQPTSMTLDQAQAIVDQAHHQQQQNGGGYNPSEGYNTHDSANHAINNAASALYLLSQQQIQRHNQNQAQNALAQGQGQVNPSAVSAPPQQQLAESPTSPTGPTRRATKRKTMEAPAPVPRGKKAKNAAGAAAAPSVSTRNSGRRKNSKFEEDDEDDFDEDEEDDDTYMDGIMGPPSVAANNRGSTRGSKKPETEEEKRKNFLERNRQAALKCRQRKKAWLQALQQKVEFLTAENERLSNALVTSREEVARLSQAVVAAGGAPSALLNLDPNGNPTSSNAPNGTPMMGNVNPASVSVENNANSPIDRARRGSSSSNNTAPGQIQTSQPVHVNVPQHMANGMSHVQHAHSHSLGHSLPQSHASGMGHSRSHSHGHNMAVPAAQNGVTVGGRGYGY